MGTAPEQAYLSAELAAAYQAGREAWPELEITARRFGAFVTEHAAATAGLSSAADEAMIAGAVGQLRIADLYLACGCLDGDEAAVSAFERANVTPLSKTLRRLSLSDAAVEEIKQQLRQELLVGTKERPPKLTSYAGRGRLSGWVSVIAVRMALKYKRHREVPVEAKLLEEVPAPSEDPELDHLRRQYREPFRDAVQRAFDVLSVRQRNLLQQHYIDGLTTYQLAGLYRVDQSTATRWLARARQAVLEGTRATLRDVLQLERGDLDSLMRAVRSQLEITMRAQR